MKLKIENGILYEKVFVPRKNIGECPYCKLPVLASEGQAIKYLNDKPTHKKCRP